MYSLIVTAKMNDIDPQAWLADVLARIAGHPASQARRAAAVELAPGKRGGQQGSLKSAGPAVLTACLRSIQSSQASITTAVPPTK